MKERRNKIVRIANKIIFGQLQRQEFEVIADNSNNTAIK